MFYRADTYGQFDAALVIIAVSHILAVFSAMMQRTAPVDAALFSSRAKELGQSVTAVVEQV